jgi:hypothetical protein
MNLDVAAEIAFPAIDQRIGAAERSITSATRAGERRARSVTELPSLPHGILGGYGGYPPLHSDSGTGVAPPLLPLQRWLS